MLIGDENRLLLDITLGSYLKKLRESKNYTQKELGEILNLSGTAIGFIENGKRMVSMLSLYDYSNHFSIDIKELIEKRIITINKTYEMHGGDAPNHILDEYYLITYYTLLT